MEKEIKNPASPSFPTFRWITISAIGGMFFLIALRLILLLVDGLLRTGKPDIEGIYVATTIFAVKTFFAISFIVIPSIILWRVLYRIFPAINKSSNYLFISISAIYLLVLSVIYALFTYFSRNDLVIIMLGTAFEMYFILLVPRIIFSKLKPRMQPAG